MCPEPVKGHIMITCFRLQQCGAVLAGVKAKPFGWLTASLDPSSGGAHKNSAGSRRGE
jgi:hypothetical protein